jgi:hypothetical protein
MTKPKVMIREGLPTLPDRMRGLAIDARGYPVPWFVKFFDGKPDFRVADAAKFRKAITLGLCWICGEPLGVRRTFVLGPMCTVNRITSEPATHINCATFAAVVCPFLILPQAKRRENNLPSGIKEPPGDHHPRNPGAVCLWTAKEYKVIPMAGGGRLIKIGEPLQTLWYAEGKFATRVQAERALKAGIAILYAKAKTMPRYDEAIIELENQVAEAQQYLPMG